MLRGIYPCSKKARRVALTIAHRKVDLFMAEIKGEIHRRRHRLAEVVPLDTPYVMFIDPSSVCNFRCRFCPSNNMTAEQGMQRGFMSEETFCKVLDGMAEFPRKVKVVELYCIGEPLLNKRTTSMIHELKYSGGGYAEKVRLTTNGSCLTHELSFALVEAGLDYMKVSIEALDAAGYKDICGADIDFGHLVEEIGYLYSISRGRTEIAIKIVDAALHSEEDKQRFLETFAPISDFTFIEKLKAIWSEYDGVPVDAGLDVSDLDYYTRMNSNHEICAYPLTHMLIHSNGDIGVCGVDWKHGTVYGNVHSMTLREAWNSESLRRFRLAHLQGRRKEIPFCCHCSQVSNDDVDADAAEIAKKLEHSGWI